jgi:drug/metabolite transporter (DMT)-like permease
LPERERRGGAGLAAADTEGDASLPPTPAARHALGIGLTVLAVFMFTMMDTIGKTLTATYPVQQVVWARYFFSLLVLLLLIPPLGVGRLVRTRHLGLQIGRGALVALATLCLFTAIRVVPLADAYAITFTAPLLVTLFSIPLLGERVGWRRWSAILIGFTGVLIVIRPGIGAMHWALLMPLVTAVCFALYQILTRKVAGMAGETAFALLFYLSLVGAVVLSAIMPFFWRPVAPQHWGWMAAMGFLGALGHLLLIRALTLTPASLVAPFTYSQIILAIALGYLVFGDLPDAWMLIGCAVIIGSGLYVFYREAVLGRA